MRIVPKGIDLLKEAGSHFYAVVKIASGESGKARPEGKSRPRPAGRRATGAHAHMTRFTSLCRGG
jgi:hypothetical protein